MNFWEAFSICPIVNEITLETAMDMTLKSKLTNDQKKQLANVLTRFDFAGNNSKLGSTTLMKHTIDVGDAKPFKQKQYVHSPYMQQKINDEIDRLLELKVIERATCPRWLSPIIPVQKANGSIRLVLDGRKLNQVTVKNFYPQQNANRILARLRGSKYLSSLDLSDAYYHLEIDEASRDYTAFAVSSKGTFRYRKMANGLTNASATLCECIDLIMGCDLEPYVFVYMDDFLILTDDFDHHLKLIQTVIERLNNAGFMVNLEKSQFCRPQIKFLGLHISEKGIEADQTKIQSIVDYPAPTTLKRARRLIGMVVWHDRFIEHFSSLLAPITDTLKNPHLPYKWTPQADLAFVNIKKALVNSPILALPDYNLPFRIHCDASNVGVGAMLTQLQNNSEKVIAYYSAKLTPTQQRYFTTEKECLAVILSLENFKKYFDGTHVTVFTDHASLIWLNRFKESNGRLVRWALRLQEFNITIQHKKGKHMQVPDALSRIHEIDLVDCDSFDTSNDQTYKDLIELTLSDKCNSEYTFEYETLYKKVKFKDQSSVYRIYIPQDRVAQALEECHDLPTAAHGGFHKTLHRLKQSYYWPTMESDTRNHVANCDVCKRVKQANYNLTPPMGKQRLPDRPWSTIAIDFMGPLTRSAKGNKWILTIIDCYSEFAIFHPCRDATATIVAQVLEEKVFMVFGVPNIIISDNGSQFKSKIYADLAIKYKYALWYTPFYHSQANPSECANKIIGNAIRCYIVNDEDQRNWDKNIAYLSSAINSSFHSATKNTPYEIIFGRPYNITGEKNLSITGVGEQSLRSFNEIHAKVSLQLQIAYEKSKKQYNLRARPITLSVGDIVYHRNFKQSNKAAGYSAKLAPKYIKAKIIEKLGPAVYKVQDDNGNAIGTYHSKDLKLNNS